MFYDYKILLILGMFVSAGIVISWKNSFDRAQKTALRFILAIVVVWAYLIMSRFIVVEIDKALAVSQEELNSIAYGDGAKNLFALLFGWVPGILVVAIMWAITRSWFWLRARLSSKQNDNI